MSRLSRTVVRSRRRKREGGEAGAAASSSLRHIGSVMEQPLAAAALALDFVQQLPAHSGTPLSGILTWQRKLFEPEIRKHQGQLTSHASGDFVALFPKPVSAVICALSLHRMFAALSQSMPELKNFQIRIGIHAEASADDDTEAQRKCIAVAHELKERALHGNILVSRAVASTIDETWPVQLKPAGEHKPAAPAKAFGLFELKPSQLKPLPVIRTSRRFAQMRVPLAAAIGLIIMGGTGYGYLYQAGAVEWPPAPGVWLEKARETAQQQIDSSIGSLERRARAIIDREPSISRGDALQKAAAAIPVEPSPESNAVSIASSEAPLSRGEALQRAAASHWKLRELSESDEIGIASSEGAANSQAPISWGDAFQRAAASLWKPGEPSPDSVEVSIAAMDESAEDAAIVQPAKPGSQQSAPLPEEKTTKQQQVASATEAPAKPEVTMPVQEVSVAAPQQPEAQQKPQQQQKLKAESTQIAAASAPEQSAASQAQPAQPTSPAPSEPTALGPTAESPTAKPEPSFTTLSQKQRAKGESARTAAVSAQKPSAPPAQVSQRPPQPPVQQTEQVASITPAVVDQAAISVTTEPPAAEAEGSATILPQQPTLAKKLPAQAPQNSAKATEKLLEPEQGPSATVPQAEHPKRQAEIISAPEQPSTQAPVKSAATAPKVASLATEKATGNATKPQVLASAKLRATKAQLETETVEAQVQDCKALRKAFRRGTLVRSVDKAAYRRLVACQRLKNDQKQGPVRIAGKAFNQGTNQPGSDGGATGGGSTGGPGNSGGNGKARARARTSEHARFWRSPWHRPVEHTCPHSGLYVKGPQKCNISERKLQDNIAA